MQRRETIPVMKKMRRLMCSVPWIYRERKQSSDGGWNREEVHMSVEGVVVRQGGMLCRGCFESFASMEWWDALKYIIDTVQSIYKFLRFADQDKKPNMCEVVMAYQTMKQELKSFFGTNVSTLKEYVEVVDERLDDVFIGTYVGPGKHISV